jgi:hypothetical protein
MFWIFINTGMGMVLCDNYLYSPRIAHFQMKNEAITATVKKRLVP